MKNLKIICLFLIGSVFSGCQSQIPDFNDLAAFELLKQQCAFGPRNPGSEGYTNCRQFLIDELSAYADTVFLQPFTYTDLREGNSYDLTNIIAQFNPDYEKQILLGAHWDTRPWAERDPSPERRNQPILGANDGASGVAVLLELGRIIALQQPAVGITIVLFDGEDLGVTGTNDSYARGSLYFAENLPVEKPDYAIVLDMIGDADLEIPIERNSYKYNRELVTSLWSAAATLNLDAFKNWLGFEIFDDHVPLWEAAGIPAIDLIDIQYPNRYANYWHTHSDVPANCSAESLGQVGTLLVHHIYSLK